MESKERDAAMSDETTDMPDEKQQPEPAANTTSGGWGCIAVIVAVPAVAIMAMLIGMA